MDWGTKCCAEWLFCLIWFSYNGSPFLNIIEVNSFWTATKLLQEHGMLQLSEHCCEWSGGQSIVQKDSVVLLSMVRVHLYILEINSFWTAIRIFQEHNVSLCSYYGHFMVQPVRSKIQQQCVFFQQQPDLCVVLKLRVFYFCFQLWMFLHTFLEVCKLSQRRRLTADHQMVIESLHLCVFLFFLFRNVILHAWMNIRLCFNTHTHTEYIFLLALLV